MANNFSLDSSCVALYRFESGALTTDSKGSNTLSASSSSPTADTTNFKEGAISSGRTAFTTVSVLSGGTLSVTDAIVNGAGKITITLTVISSLSLSDLDVNYTVSLNSANAITPL